MNKTELNNAFNSITPTDTQIVKIHNRITSEKAGKKKIYFKALVATFCILTMVSVYSYFNNSALKITKVTPTAPHQSSSFEERPSDYPLPRKYFTYNNIRYVPIEGGALFKFNKALTEKLGTLGMDIESILMGNNEKDLDAILNGNAEGDIETTFAFGCDVYKIPNYDMDFRIAVKQDDKFYICENVDNLDGKVSLTKYFENAKIIKKPKEVLVYDHFGTQVIGEIKRKDFERLMFIITNADNRKFSYNEYEEMGRAQSNGESFKIILTLKDDTKFSFYLIPKLNIVMVGDNTFKIPEKYNNEVQQLFSNYKNIIVPIQY